MRIRNILLGLCGGVIAAWVMGKSQTQLKKISDRSTLRNRPRKTADEVPATVLVAQTAYKGLMHRTLSPQKSEFAGMLVHYLFGGSLGAVFATLLHLQKRNSLVFGVLYGLGVWIFADNIMVPLFGFAKSPLRYPLKTHTYALISHLVYGSVLGLLAWSEEKSAAIVSDGFNLAGFA